MEIEGKTAFETKSGAIIVSEDKQSRVFPSKDAAERFYKYGPETQWIGEYEIVNDSESFETMMEIRETVEAKLLKKIAGRKTTIIECGIKDMLDGTHSVYAKAEVHIRHENQS